MFEKLLTLIVDCGIYADIKGMQNPGGETVITKDSSGDVEYYQQKGTLGRMVIFTPEMVESILFHSSGCTIVLKH